MSDREIEEYQAYLLSKRLKRARLLLWLLRVVLALLLTYCMLYIILDRSTSAMFEGKTETQRKLAESVVEMPMNVVTGSEYFDLEWMYGSEQMKALGLLSMMKEHPEFRERYRPYVEESIDYLLGDMGRGFDIDMYRYDILDSLSNPTGHIAYLGYTNLVLSAYRYLYPDNRYNEWNDRFSEAIAKRFREAPYGMVESFPEITFPIDNCPAASSLALYDEITSASHRDVLERWKFCLKNFCTDPKSGMLYMNVDYNTGIPTKPPRASATAFGCYFLSYGMPDVAACLYEDLIESCYESWGLIGLVREYPAWIDGKGDSDSGPLILGFSPSGCACTLGCARFMKDESVYRNIMRTLNLVGVPDYRDGRLSYGIGGSLGNNLLFAMLTAQPEWRNAQ